MLATAHFAKEHGLEFDYFCRPLSTNARSEVQGNLALSLSLGMHLHECSDINKALEEFRASHDMSHILDLPRGVSCKEAEEGIAQLAQEIHDHFVQNFGGSRSSCLVFLPSGTGTTATFLNRHLQRLSRLSGHKASVIGVSVAMKPADLLRQIQAQYPHEELGYPLFTHPSRKRIRFAVPDHSVKAIWCAMKRKGVELDLIYGPVAWMTLFEYLPNIDPRQTEVYYIHTGGLTGNDTQMHRYTALTCKVPTPQL
jgi:1-aminocyclopropane-1-carboxylate deaminase/D-cysteine desulfhydrase-like pyridoxal-dependent ACC family enzyme